VRIGYACINLSLQCRSSRTFRLKSYGAEKMRDTVGGNLSCLRKQLECMEVMQKSFVRAYEAGVRIATGPDYFGAPMRAHGDNADEVISMVRYGMRPADAIVATTRTSAECVGVEQDYGTAEKGKIADLIAIEGNPLDDIGLVKTGIRFVMKGGRVFRQD